jgi:hypothetical protein
MNSRAKFAEGQAVTIAIPGTRDRVPVTVVTAWECVRGREKFVYDIRWPGGYVETSVPERRLRRAA